MGGRRELEAGSWLILTVNTVLSLVIHMICPPFIQDLYLECMRLYFLLPFKHL